MVQNFSLNEIFSLNIKLNAGSLLPNIFVSAFY
jgi:hypothetical protein